MVLSVPAFYFPPPGTPLRQAKDALIILEFIDLSYITVEYFLRLFTAPKIKKHLKDPWAIIDLLTFVPFWINVAIYYTEEQDIVEPDVGIVRFFNVFRFLRLFKVTRHTRVGRVLTTTLKRSIYPVLMFFQQACILIMISGTVVFYAEQSGSVFDRESSQWVLDDGTVSSFQSIPISLWWAVVTIATVGYGDMYPQTPLGKLAGAVVILVGVLLVALPVGVFASTFAEVAKEYDEQFKLERIERRRRKQWNLMNRGQSGVELRSSSAAENDTNYVALENKNW